ncbi:hypothetical protein [Methylobacterium sp. WL19]|uniref:hypothetical protein n=1 Tax=Methylobacterium sp. WL19 TaxID=2603896 RepID=UPI0011C7251E|nr:hypothetical protein [Methylobacterium sp. WL19]TXN26877.1 hypothetical protein FV220_13640 [Methylobacterium sp. WL19]
MPIRAVSFSKACLEEAPWHLYLKFEVFIMYKSLFLTVLSVLFLSYTPVLAQFSELHEKDRLVSVHAPAVRALLNDTPTIRSKFQSIRVNQPHEAGSLNIYLINAALDLKQIVDQDTKRALTNIRRNARAVPPDSIFIDNDLLSILAYNAQIDVNYRAESTRVGIDLLTTKRRAEDRPMTSFLMARSGRVAGILSDIDRFEALFSRRNNLPDPLMLGRAVSLAGQTFNLPDSYFASNMFLVQASLAPLLFHEVGHLVAGSEGDFYSLITNFFDRRTREKVQVLEQKADEFAARAIAELYKVQKLSDESLVRIYQTVFLRQPPIASIKYMRDDALIKLFDGYRGLHYEDLFFQIYHRACGLVSNSSYGNSHNIMFGKFGYVPILRSREREALRQQLNSYLASSTHAHGIIRSDKFFEMFQASTGEDLSGLSSLYSGMLNRLINDEKELFPDYFPAKGLGVSSSNVMTALGATYVEEGKSCESCKIGELQDGYVEVLGADNDLGVIRLVYRNYPNAQNRVDVSIIKLYAMISAVNKSVKADRKFMENILSVTRIENDNCGFADTLQFLGDTTIDIRRSFSERAFMITIMAGKDLNVHFLKGKYSPKDLLSEFGVRGIMPNPVVRPQEFMNK